MQKLLTLHNWVLLPNDNVSMSVGHLDHVLLTVYSSMEHVTWKSHGPICVAELVGSCIPIHSWKAIGQGHSLLNFLTEPGLCLAGKSRPQAQRREGKAAGESVWWSQEKTTAAAPITTTTTSTTTRLSVRQAHQSGILCRTALRDPVIGRNSFRQSLKMLLLQRTDASSALEVSRQCAI